MTDFLKQSLLHTKVSTNQSFTLSNQILIKQHAAGILEVIPPKAKNAMIISCGVHGNETIPLELVDHLVNSILCEKFHPSWQLLFIIAHPKAIAHHKRYLDENLNRLFKKCGSNLLAAEAAYSTIEQKIAHKLQFYMQQFYLSLAPDIEPWHLDLHSTLRASQHPQFAVIPVSATKHAKKLNELSQHAKLNATLAATQASPTMSWWSAQYFNAIAMTVELGQVSPLYQNDLSPYQGFVLALQAMICDESLPMLDKQKAFTRYVVSRTLYKRSEQFTLTFADTLPNFSFFPAGKVIAIENTVCIKAQAEGEVVIFPNANVALGQRALLLAKKEKTNY